MRADGVAHNVQDVPKVIDVAFFQSTGYLRIADIQVEVDDASSDLDGAPIGAGLEASLEIRVAQMTLRSGDWTATSSTVSGLTTC